MVTNTTQNAGNEAIINNVNAKQHVIKEAELNRLLNELKNVGTKFRDIAKKACMQALLYAFVHNDYTQATKVLYTMKDNMSENTFKGVRKWFEAHGPFAWRKTDDKNFPDGLKFRKSNSENANQFDIEAAFKVHPLDFAKLYTQEEVDEHIAKALKVGNVLNRLERLMKDLTTAIEQGNIEGADDEIIEGETTLEAAQEILENVSSVVLKFKPPVNKTGGDDEEEQSGNNKSNSTNATGRNTSRAA